MNFSVGDVVQLKSGGPAMTVEEVCLDAESDSIYCTWFDKAEKKGASFYPATLKIYTDPSFGG